MSFPNKEIIPWLYPSIQTCFIIFGRIQLSHFSGCYITNSLADIGHPVSQGSGDPGAIAVDDRAGKLYWTNTATNEIWRSNLDGSSAAVFINTGLVTPTGIEVDSLNGKLYWTDLGNSTIQRVNLDGTGRVTLLSAANGLSAPSGIDLDVAGGKLYWVDDGTNRVQRANLDGSNIETSSPA